VVADLSAVDALAHGREGAARAKAFGVVGVGEVGIEVAVEATGGRLVVHVEVTHGLGVDDGAGGVAAQYPKAAHVVDICLFRVEHRRYGPPPFLVAAQVRVGLEIGADGQLHAFFEGQAVDRGDQPGGVQCTGYGRHGILLSHNCQR